MKVNVISKQKNVKVKHNGNPEYEFSFTDNPIEMEESIAQHICQNDNFEIVGKEKKKETKLEDMTKDELNDYAAINGLKDEVDTSMRKDEMIKKIKEKLGG